MQAIVHPASASGVPGGEGNSVQVASHPHVHVEEQSESTLHVPVCWAMHVFHVTVVHVVPASQMAGMAGGVGAALHGMVVTVSYAAVGRMK